MTTAPQLPAESRVRNDDSIPVYPSTGTTGPRRVEVSTLKTKLTDDGFLTDDSGASGTIGVLEATVAASALTNAGGAVGTYDLATLLPEGARVLATQVHATVGFTGDTTATIQVGTAADPDRFSTGTPSIFAAGHADMGVPSGAVFVSADATVQVTVTSTADIDAVIAAGGIAIVKISYLKGPA